jgi:deferrochelatase/peroxidase EfeB
MSTDSWPRFDAKLWLTQNGSLVVVGSVGPPTDGTVATRVEGFVSQYDPEDKITALAVGSTTLVAEPKYPTQSLKSGNFRFQSLPLSGTFQAGKPAFAYAEQTDYKASGVINTVSWSLWVEIMESRIGDGAWGPLITAPLFEEGWAARVGGTYQPVNWRALSNRFQGMTDDAAAQLLAKTQETLLDALQANVIRPHTRPRMYVTLVEFKDGVDNKQLLRDMALAQNGFPGLKTAKQQLDEGETNTTAFVSVGLSFSGFNKLRVEPPNSPALIDGMRKRRETLRDPDIDPDKRNAQPDAIIIVGGPAAEADAAMNAVRNGWQGKFASWREKQGDKRVKSTTVPPPAPTGLADFFDGKSQPIFVLDPVLDQHAVTPHRWSPIARLDQVLRHDPGNAEIDKPYFGSLLVYRQYELDDTAYTEAVRKIAEKCAGGSRVTQEGGLLVGRFADGTSLELLPWPAGSKNVSNDFTYAGDDSGTRCPTGAHVRVMDPRVRSAPPIARRSQAYADGLLFLAYMSDIETQFEVLQTAANGGPEDKLPVDPIIGRPKDGAAHVFSFAKTWGIDDKAEVEISEPLAKLVDGDYFFVPSIPFLQTLA